MERPTLKSIGVMLPEEHLKRLQEEAYRRTVSVGAMVREAVREYCEKREKPQAA